MNVGEEERDGEVSSVMVRLGACGDGSTNCCLGMEEWEYASQTDSDTLLVRK